MTRRRTVLLISITLLLFPSSSFSQLSVKGDGIYGSKPAYIDDATLVVEPHGAYVEQSLYLTYSDHNQFGGTTKIELVHRFRLPTGAVVNDMWLWFDDNVMQARMFDTWTARHMYDSIVTTKKDPAYLTKIGENYELRIYPLLPGKSRKVKLNFIVPAKWYGEHGVAELPLQMLKDNSAANKPIEILFRCSRPIWGVPGLIELPQNTFASVKDTNGYTYQGTNIRDVTNLTSLTFGYNTSFTAGYFFSSNDVKDEGMYFQFGFVPGPLFKLSIDSSAQRLLFGLDLSGAYSKNFTTLIPALKQFIRSASKPGDSINVVAAGGGSVQPLASSWRIAHPDTINNMLDRFVVSDLGKKIAVQRAQTILYADAHASTCWQFPGLTDIASVQNYTSLLTALNYFQSANIIAAYDHGYEQTSQTHSSVNTILAKVDSFFLQGGRLLSYFDHNRNNNELIGSHYIRGLSAAGGVRLSGTVYRKASGNFGINFPESAVPHVFELLTYDPDPDVKIELQNEQGQPVVISKKIGNGLLVISAIWSFTDDGALRALLGAPMLGLNVTTQPQQLRDLLTDIRIRYNKMLFKKAFVISNGDSLIQKGDVATMTSSYLGDFFPSKPVFNTINIIDGSGFIPPYLTEGQVTYYGNGYFLKSLSDASKGSHYELHSDTWGYINSALSAYSVPRADSLWVTASVDGGAGQLNEMREVSPNPMDAAKARFFIGSSTLASNIQFTIKARFGGGVGAKDSVFSFYVDHDTSTMDKTIPSMLGFERLKDKFNAGGKDTAGIVKLAMQYRLLTDYTALLALEPNDTIRFIKNPFDESRLTDIGRTISESIADSLTLQSYPNPFNSQTSIVVNVSRPSFVNVCVYNILGQLVRVLAAEDLVSDRKVYSWNGGDLHDRSVNSGVYFIRLVAKERVGGKTVARLRKIVLLK